MPDRNYDQLDKLIAEREIRNALFRYCRGIDRKDWALFRSAYHDDAHDDHGVYRGDPDGLVSWLKVRHENIAQSMHFIGNCWIDLDADKASGEVYCIVIQRSGDTKDGAAGSRTTIGCRYLDRYERRDGIWRIANRLVVYEWIHENGTGSADGAPERVFPNGLIALAQRSEDDPVYGMRGRGQE